MINLTAIVLTFNEEKHIARCIRSLQTVCQEIFLVDSFSTDKTVDIAQDLGAKVYQNKWENNYAKQLNWGIANLPINSEWIIRLDADEYLMPELQSEISDKLNNLANNINGIYLKRRMIFLNKWISHGGMYPIYALRIWRYGKGQCEQRWMDEHIKVIGGITIKFDNDFIDDNLNNITW